jgi:hypothetical protein
MKTEEQSIISKSEAARRWGLTPSAVTAYVSRGLPVRADGRIDWSVAAEWRRQFVAPERSGNFASRQAKQAPSDFDRGARWMATEVCVGARRALPKFASTLSLPDLATKVVISTVLITLLEEWTNGYTQSNELPPIDWSSFGEDANAIGAEASGLMREWKAAAQQEAKQ